MKKWVFCFKQVLLLIGIVALMQSNVHASDQKVENNDLRHREMFLENRMINPDFIAKANMKIHGDGIYSFVGNEVSEGVSNGKEVFSQDILSIINTDPKKNDDLKNQIIFVRLFSRNSISSQVARSTGGSQYEYLWDTSITVKAYSTVYYSYVTIGGKKYCKMLRTSGGYTNSGNGVYVTSQKVTLAQIGSADTGGGQQASTTYTIGNKTTSWTRYPLASWRPVSTHASPCKIVASTAISLSRGGSSWSFTLRNAAIDQ